MALTFGTSQNVASNSASGTVPSLVMPTGTDLVVLVFEEVRSSTSLFTGVTWTPSGGSATNLSLHGTNQANGSAYTRLWYAALGNGASGLTGTIAWSRGTSTRTVTGAIGVAGVDQANPIGNSLAGIGTTLVPTIGAITTAAGNGDLGGACTINTMVTPTHGASQNTLWQTANSTHAGFGDSVTSPGATQGFTWTQTGTAAAWSALGIEVAAASAGGAAASFVPPLRRRMHIWRKTT